MPTLLHDAINAEVLEVEQRLDTFQHKARKVLNFFRLEIQRTCEELPATKELYERIGIHRLMSLRLLAQLLDRIAACQPATEDDRHLAKLLLSAGQRLADSTAKLSRKYGELDFSNDLPERIASEMGTDLYDAMRDAFDIRLRRNCALAHRENIFAEARGAGSI